MGTSKKQKKREWLQYRDFVLSPYGVIKIKSLGYSCAISPHRFRHTIATNLMSLPDRNIKMAQELLCHSTPAVTLQYVETDLNRVRTMLEELEAA